MHTLAEILVRKDMSRADKALTLLLFSQKRENSIGDLQELAREAGQPYVKKWNCSQLLGKRPEFAVRFPTGWELTSKGRNHLESLGVVIASGSGTPPAVAQDLRAVLRRITAPDTRSFVEEAIACYENKQFRAAVVLSWIGAVSVLHKVVIDKYLSQFNKVAAARDAKWKNATNADHLGLMKEDDFLDILADPAVGVLGKNVKEELKLGGLKLRNGCGHPNTLKIGPAKVAAHIEGLILNVFVPFT